MFANGIFRRVGKLVSLVEPSHLGKFHLVSTLHIPAVFASLDYLILYFESDLASKVVFRRVVSTSRLSGRSALYLLEFCVVD